MRNILNGTDIVDRGPRVTPEYRERDAPSNAVEWAFVIGIVVVAATAAKRVLRMWT